MREMNSEITDIPVIVPVFRSERSLNFPPSGALEISAILEGQETVDSRFAGV